MKKNPIHMTGIVNGRVLARQRSVIDCQDGISLMQVCKSACMFRAGVCCSLWKDENPAVICLLLAHDSYGYLVEAAYPPASSSGDRDIKQAQGRLTRIVFANRETAALVAGRGSPSAQSWAKLVPPASDASRFPASDLAVSLVAKWLAFDGKSSHLQVCGPLFSFRQGIGYGEPRWTTTNC